MDRVNVQMEPRQTTATPEEPVFFTIECNDSCPLTTVVDYIRIIISTPLMYSYSFFSLLF